MSYLCHCNACINLCLGHPICFGSWRGGCLFKLEKQVETHHFQLSQPVSDLFLSLSLSLSISCPLSLSLLFAPSLSPSHSISCMPYPFHSLSWFLSLSLSIYICCRVKTWSKIWGFLSQNLVQGCVKTWSKIFFWLFFPNFIVFLGYLKKHK